jgi:hypothetical protein
MEKDNGDITIKKAIDDLLKTDIFKNIIKRNDNKFAEKLAIWLVRYILVISSMKESLKIDLETVLLNIHGEKFKKILEVTENSFMNANKDSDSYHSYIQ